VWSAIPIKMLLNAWRLLAEVNSLWLYHISLSQSADCIISDKFSEISIRLPAIGVEIHKIMAYRGLSLVGKLINYCFRNCKDKIDAEIPNPRHVTFQIATEEFCTFETIAKLENFRLSTDTKCGTVANYIQSLDEDCYYSIILATSFYETMWKWHSNL
jgi:hypothetical protein